MVASRSLPMNPVPPSLPYVTIRSPSRPPAKLQYSPLKSLFRIPGCSDSKGDPTLDPRPIPRSQNYIMKVIAPYNRDPGATRFQGHVASPTARPGVGLTGSLPYTPFVGKIYWRPLVPNIGAEAHRCEWSLTVRADGKRRRVRVRACAWVRSGPVKEAM